MATIRKHRNKYQVQVRRTGVAPSTKTFTLLADAKEWARHQERLADRAELGPDRKELERITLAKLVQRYIDEIVPVKKGAEIERIVLEAFLRHKICKKRLSELTTADFATYRDERLKTITTKSLKRQIAPLSNMFEIARLDWNLPLRSNPLTDLALKVTDNKRDRRLREGEFAKLLEAGRKTRNPLLIPIVRLALETAMRRGEIIALRFRDVDIERCTATIRDSKNGHSRTIPLSLLAVEILETRIAAMNDKARVQNARIFPITPVAVRLAWDKLAKRAKVDDLHFHDLRHEAISRFFEKGLTVPEVASISGHRDIRMLLRYAHADRGKLAQKLN
ncbi:site-specific integrase [Mesorhizobium sp. WSM4904]|uniref:site-specific integrase n=1 Tax=Mesorhizobium sp. WSM4904 TaxID=3038545 RepID=UPI002418660F|nr:site-specific integrase [Mesorhizobium sp. WSM4904]WFP65117.1 site-specific integrase [Mesorhizobium sp. WSM4904]